MKDARRILLAAMLAVVALFGSARADDQSLRPGPPTRLTPNGRNGGVTGRDARWSVYPHYIDQLENSVLAAWKEILSAQKSQPPEGSVVITFVLTSSGDIRLFVQVKPSLGMSTLGTRACEAALRNPAPFGPWTKDMIDVLGNEQQLTFTFFYEKSG